MIFFLTSEAIFGSWVCEMAAKGEIKLTVAGEFSPEQATDAQQMLAKSGVRGRPVIVFND